MEYNVPDLLFKAFIALTQLALFMYVRNSNRNDEVDKRFDQLQTAQSAQDHSLGLSVGTISQRLSRLEVAIESTPNHTDLAKVYEALNHLSGTVNQLVGENRSQSDTLRMMLSQLTEKGMR